jgi:transcriptional regulator of acetoin/glycerol metabolism
VGRKRTDLTSFPSSREPRARSDDARERLADVLRETGGNLSRSARRLGVARSTLRWLQGLIP